MGCKFERVSAYADCDLPMPVRKTKNSAAYDICAVEDVIVPSFFSSFMNMVTQRISDKNFSDKVTSMIEEAADDLDLLEAIASKDPEAITPAINKYLIRFNGDFTFDLKGIKALVKEASAKLTLIPTGVKCQLEDDQVLHLYIRSSCPLNNYLFLGNGVGVIDADYYNNKDNEGHIFFQIINLSPFDIIVKKGDIIGQGEITRFCRTDDDIATGERVGGFGSTNA